MMRAGWIWPFVILLSALAVCVCTFVYPSMLLRPLIAIWFLFVCPGMAFVRLLRLGSTIAEWTIAVALSFAIDGIVAGVLLYMGRWSPALILVIIVGLSAVGAFMSLFMYGVQVQHKVTWEVDEEFGWK